MKTLTLSLICLLMALSSYASHVVGSDFSYEHIAGSAPGNFRIRMVLYRDCSGIPMCPNTCGAACSRTVQLFGTDTLICGKSPLGNVTLNLVSVRDVALSPRCPDAKNTCTNMGCVTPGTFSPGIERYEFVGTVNLSTLSIPSSCCTIKFVWEECCRNSGITTGASGQNYYIENIMNRCLATTYRNNSPVLTNDPVTSLCKGQPFVFNGSAVDPDLDSLSYAFVPSLQRSGVSVSYTSPYAYDKPMPWIGPANGVFPAGISCDPNTGDIMFTTPANTDAVGVMAVAITEWKNINGTPTIMGVTRRDIQMITITCPPNNPPYLATIPTATDNLPKTAWDVCAGEQLCFDIIAKDSDHNPPTISDTTFLTWNANLLKFGATFIPNYNPSTRKTQGPREDSYKFCWTPHDSLGSHIPYYFIVTAKDNRCPVQGSHSKAMSIMIRPKPDVTITQNILSCGKRQLSYILPTNKPIQTFIFRSYQISRKPGDYAFSNGAYTFNNTQTTPVISFTESGRYLVLFTLSSPGPIGGAPCTRVYYDTITIDSPFYSPEIPVIAGDTIVTDHNDTVTYSSAIQAGFSHWWSVTNGMIVSGQGTDSIRVKWLTRSPGTVKLVVKNAVNCGDSTILQVFVGNVGLLSLNQNKLASVFPNPAKSSITIQSDLILEDAEILVMDLAGKTLMSKKVTEKNKTIEWNIEVLKPGAYIIHIQHHGSQMQQKLIKE